MKNELFEQSGRSKNSPTAQLFAERLYKKPITYYANLTSSKGDIDAGFQKNLVLYRKIFLDQEDV